MSEDENGESPEAVYEALALEFLAALRSTPFDLDRQPVRDAAVADLPPAALELEDEVLERRRQVVGLFARYLGSGAMTIPELLGRFSGEDRTRLSELLGSRTISEVLAGGDST